MLYLLYVMALTDSYISEPEITEAAHHLADKADRAQKITNNKIMKRRKNYKFGKEMTSMKAYIKEQANNHKEKGVTLWNQIWF